MPPAKKNRKISGQPAPGRWFHEPDAPATSLGTAIKLRRTELGLSRRELAERAGLSYPYVAELENGAKQGSPKALEAIARALELRPSELLAWSDDLAETRGTSPSDPRHWRNVRRASAAPAAAPPAAPAAMYAEMPAVPQALFAGGGPPPTTPAAEPRSARALAARIADVVRDADPAVAEEALLLVLGEERVRDIVRDELEQHRE
jgi:transcriptional regulator with XRE-family HTH domain